MKKTIGLLAGLLLFSLPAWAQREERHAPPDRGREQRDMLLQNGVQLLFAKIRMLWRSTAIFAITKVIQMPLMFIPMVGGSDMTQVATTLTTTSITPGSTAISLADSVRATSGTLAEADQGVSGLAGFISAWPRTMCTTVGTGCGTEMKSLSTKIQTTSAGISPTM